MDCWLNSVPLNVQKDIKIVEIPIKQVAKTADIWGREACETLTYDDTLEQVNK